MSKMVGTRLDEDGLQLLEEIQDKMEDRSGVRPNNSQVIRAAIKLYHVYIIGDLGSTIELSEEVPPT